jgi:hypothetical protein
MAGDGVHVQGLRELVRDLEGVGVEVADLKEAFGGIAKRAADLAASFAPRRTGRLRASIRGDRAKNKATVRAGGAKAPYSGAINYGWRRRGIAPSGFMQRADAQIRPTVTDDIEAALVHLIQQRGLS